MQKRICGREHEYPIILDPPPKFRRNKDTGSINTDSDFVEKLIFKLIHGIPKVADGIIPSTEKNLSATNSSDLWMANGYRVYPDLEKLETASPECLAGSYDLITQERAMEIILNKVLKWYKKRKGCKRKIILLKNNVSLAREDSPPKREDLNKLEVDIDIFDEISYGCHHNYSCLLNKKNKIIKLLNNFIPASVIISGNGNLVRLLNGKFVYTISQRAPHIVNLFTDNLEDRNSQYSRPMGYFKDLVISSEDKKLHRLQIVARDATRCEYQTWLIDGITHLVIRLAEEGWQLPYQLSLVNPIKDFHQANLYPNLKYKVKTRSKKINIVEYNYIFLRAAKRLKNLSEIEKKCIKEWKRVLDLMRTKKIESLIGEIDWITKWFLLKLKMKQYNFDLNDIRARLININYHNISDNPNESWFARLDKDGIIRHLVSEKLVEKYLSMSPQNTKAKIRSDFIKLFLNKKIKYQVEEITWTSATFDAVDNSETIELAVKDDPFETTCKSFEEFKNKYLKSR